MIEYYFRSLKNKNILKQKKKRVGSWLVVSNSTKEELDQLAVKHNFDEVIIEDVLDEFEVPRFEVAEGVGYMFSRYPINTADGEASTAPILCVISSEYLMSATYTKPAFIKKLLKHPDTVTTQRMKLLLAIMEQVAIQYDKSLSSIRRETTKYFGNFDSITDEDIQHFVGLESTASDYISALSTTSVALKKFLSSKVIKLHADDEEFVIDLLQDFNQLTEQARSLQNIIKNIRDAYSTILANKLNRTIRFLTLMTVTLTVPTLIASIFGMNTWIPFGDGPESFVYALIIIGVAAVLSALALFKD